MADSGAGVKENYGKASRLKMSHQLAFIFAIAFVAVALVRSLGSGSWHSKPAQHEELVAPGLRAHGVNQNIATDKVDPPSKAGSEQGQQNFIQFEFSNLDGESGHDGIVVVELHPDWAPLGVERFKELTAASFWDGCRAFRVLKNFVVQLGINGNPEVQKKWVGRQIKDDPVKMSNKRGTITFAMSGPNTRTSQIFFNIGKKNAYLDKEGFSPIGEVVKGMEFVDRVFQGYGEKPHQGMIQRKGNEYLSKEFPQMSFIKSAKFVATA